MRSADLFLPHDIVVIRAFWIWMADESYNDNVKTARGKALLLSKDELRWETLWRLTSKDASSPEK